jgi:hypothetical protein
MIENIDFSSARIMAAQPLKGLYGNYTLLLQAQDLGIPSNAVTTEISICVNDFNDNTPRFISPQHNTTIRVPEVCHITFWENLSQYHFVNNKCHTDWSNTEHRLL